MWSDILAWFVNINLGLFSLIFVSIFGIDILRLPLFIVKGFAFFRRSKTPSQLNLKGTFGASRRQFLSDSARLGIMGATGSITLFGINEALASPRIQEVQIVLPHLPDAMEGFRIAQITDLHVGPTIKENFVRDVVEKVNQLGADIVVVTGDLVDGSVPYLRNDVSPLGDLSAPQGKFFVTGNHEYYSGVHAWVEEIDRLGFDVLLNRNRILRLGSARCLLGGVTDFQGGLYFPEHQSSPKAAISNAPPTDIKILLAHQPKNVFEASKAGFDFQISGHTHGGQYVPWNYFALMANNYLSGLYRHENMWLYVSPGTGFWGPPMRLGTRSEITLFTLTRKLAT